MKIESRGIRIKIKYNIFAIFVLSLLIAVNFSIILNLSPANQIGGFFLLTFFPGLLLVQILKLEKLEKLSKLLLSVGLSIFLIMILGLFIDMIISLLGYPNPLSLINILIGFDFLIVSLLGISYKINRNKSFNFNKFNINNSEKVFLTINILLFTLSLLGSYKMQLTNNNIFLVILLILIPIFAVFVTIYGKNLKRIYPIIIFLIAFSLQLIFMLRFPHIAGADVHSEYFYFQSTLNNLHWNINLIPNNPLDSSISISILPTIYQILTNMPNHEYFFKGFYVFIFSFAPLVIYKISKKYVNETYSFLASLLFMSQYVFLKTAASPRTNLAIFFVALLIMVVFDNKIGDLQKKILCVILLVAVLLSHYSTSYILFILIALTLIITALFSKKFKLKRNLTVNIAVYFFALIFFWYGQITQNAFTKGTIFISNTLFGLNNFFIGEARSSTVYHLTGTSSILSDIYLLFTWMIFILIGFGVLTAFFKYKENLNLGYKNRKFNLLNQKIDVEFAILSLLACILLLISILIPYISKGYDLTRIYLFATVFLTFFFVFGALNLSKLFKFRFKPHIIILLILVPYSLFSTGVIYQVAGLQSEPTLTQNGTILDELYINDGESVSAVWISNNMINKTIFTPDTKTNNILTSQGLLPKTKFDTWSIPEGRSKLNGYIYLSEFNIKNGIMINDTSISIENYSPLRNKSEIYDSGYSLIYQ